MGPSGAGKSTLLHILGMHDAAWSGEFDFLGQPVHRMNPKQRNELHKRTSASCSRAITCSTT